MVQELEITVKVDCDFEELHKALVNNGFKIMQKYKVKDIYMINSKQNVYKDKPLNVLSNCILVREVVGIEKELIYKYKKYDAEEKILEQEKICCPITDIEKALKFMKSINYDILFEINDSCIVYSNNDLELVVQLVNDKYIFIEMENKPEFINKEFKTIDEMINAINRYDLPFKRDNYFVKKAEIMLRSIIEN